MNFPWSLVLEVGSFFIKLLVTNYAKKIQMQDNFNAWIEEMQARSNMSVDAHESYNKQLEELKKQEDDDKGNT